MSDVALVALAIGQPYLSNWQKYCAAGWQAYAQKHQLDLILVTEPIDRSPFALSRSPAWQKCLLLGQDFSRNYRQLVILDCDIAINGSVSLSLSAQ